MGASQSFSSREAVVPEGIRPRVPVAGHGDVPLIRFAHPIGTCLASVVPLPAGRRPGMLVLV
jgi:hypothetical protein